MHALCVSIFSSILKKKEGKNKKIEKTVVISLWFLRVTDNVEDIGFYFLGMPLMSWNNIYSSFQAYEGGGGLL